MATVRRSGEKTEHGRVQPIGDVRPEPPGSAEWRDGHNLSDSIGKELRRVGNMPRLSREKRDRLVNRKDKEPNRRLNVRRKVGELPPPRVVTHPIMQPDLHRSGDEPEDIRAERW